MISWKSQKIAGETIVVDQKEIYVFGPDLVFDDCMITISVSGNDLILPGARFNNCRIIAKKRLANVRWENIAFTGCRFSGSFYGNEFGRSADSLAEGGVVDCDFSDAKLDACGFHNVDVRAITFPRWPIFTIVNPGAHADALLAAPWPGKSRIVAEMLAECEPEYTAAVYDAAQVAKRYKVSEGELRTAVDTIPDVRL